MVRSVLPLLLLVLATVAPGTQGHAFDPAAALPSGSAPAVLGDWVRFHASFDQGPRAELAEGAADPLRVAGALRLEPGRIGGAVLLGVAGGGAELSYAVSSNLDLAQPGAISFWTANHRWREPATGKQSAYVRFLRLPGPPPAGFVLQRGYRDPLSRRDSFIAGIFELPGRRRHYLELDGGPRWQPGEWHLVVLSWDATGFDVSLDGGPLVRTSVPEELLPTRFGGGSGAAFQLGDRGAESFLLDDFTIYARALRMDDVGRLWGAVQERRSSRRSSDGSWHISSAPPHGGARLRRRADQPSNPSLK